MEIFDECNMNHELKYQSYYKKSHINIGILTLNVIINSKDTINNDQNNYYYLLK